MFCSNCTNVSLIRGRRLPSFQSLPRIPIRGTPESRILSPLFVQRFRTPVFAGAPARATAVSGMRQNHSCDCGLVLLLSLPTSLANSQFDDARGQSSQLVQLSGQVISPDLADVKVFQKRRPRYPAAAATIKTVTIVWSIGVSFLRGDQVSPPDQGTRKHKNVRRNTGPCL